MPKNKNSSPWVLLFLVLITATACINESQPKRFYSLISLAKQTENPQAQLKIGVGPIRIPRLLWRSEIVTRKTPTQVDLREKYQWGGSLREDLINVLTDNLGALLHTELIDQFPWKRTFTPDYQVVMHLEQLDGALGKSVTLKVRWRLIQGKQLIEVHHPTIQVPVQGHDYNAYVQAESEAIYRLSKQIAEVIRTQAQEK